MRPAPGRFAWDASPYLKQSLFFLLAVLLPSTALVLLSIQMLVQERELAETGKRWPQRGHPY
ncbi:MAG: hypothetical protein HS113_26030 [Verrucomicrobiales bacterium]|nr:hypothetical protein [Verrucomicrobiales bacterium]